MTIALRTVGVAIALAALIDPAIGVERRIPARVRVYLDQTDADAATVRDRLRASLDGRVRLVDRGRYAAAVVIGGLAAPDMVVPSVPLSRIVFDAAPNVAVAHAPSSLSLLVGESTDIRVQLEGHGVSGATSDVVLEQNGVELSRAQHTWRADGYAWALLPYVATTPGVRALVVRAKTAGERRIVDNHATLRVLAREQPIDVAVYEPRPSWPAGFVRRALEADAAFRVSSALRLSRGIVARTGSPSPGDLTASHLTPFDVVVIGAPEDLRAEEVRVLRQFVDLRGGTLVLLPDRRPSGPYVSLLPGEPSEHLFREPRALRPAGLLASEIIALRDARQAAVLASLEENTPVVVSRPVGDGRILFSGALDAWRFRADERSSFSRFWRETLMEAAIATPARVQLALNPGVVRPREKAHLTVRVRRTEFMPAMLEGKTLPAVAADLVTVAGRTDMIRLWPTLEAGVFEGDVVADDAGLHNVRVRTDGGATADTSLIVDAAAPAQPADGLALESIPELTGGVTAAADNLDPLVQHLARIPGSRREGVVYPMRSGWWMAPFALALCGEWALRRRRGAR